VFRDERLDYAGLKARVDEFARAFLAVGIRRGDRVALLVTKRTEWLVAAFGATKRARVGASVKSSLFKPKMVSLFGRDRFSVPACTAW
jgi:acyl-CoA synthetase (AMP-forming)/AMP-acid ligase II